MLNKSIRNAQIHLSPEADVRRGEAAAGSCLRTVPHPQQAMRPRQETRPRHVQGPQQAMRPRTETRAVRTEAESKE